MADAGLRRDAIGLREVLFQSITDMAPGAAIAASIPAGVAFAGGALPLAVPCAIASARRHEPYSQLTVLAEHKPCDLADVILFHAATLAQDARGALTWIRLRRGTP